MSLPAKTGASAKWPLGLSMPSPLAKTPEEEVLCALQSLEMLETAPSGGQPGYPAYWRHPRLPEVGTLLSAPMTTTVILKTSTGGFEGPWTQYFVFRKKKFQESDWAWVTQGWWPR